MSPNTSRTGETCNGESWEFPTGSSGRNEKGRKQRRNRRYISQAGFTQQFKMKAMQLHNIFSDKLGIFFEISRKQAGLIYTDNLTIAK
jgi:hypothetical protein